MIFGKKKNCSSICSIDTRGIGHDEQTTCRAVGGGGKGGGESANRKRVSLSHFVFVHPSAAAKREREEKENGTRKKTKNGLLHSRMGRIAPDLRQKSTRLIIGPRRPHFVPVCTPIAPLFHSLLGVCGQPGARCYIIASLVIAACLFSPARRRAVCHVAFRPCRSQMHFPTFLPRPPPPKCAQETQPCGTTEDNEGAAAAGWPPSCSSAAASACKAFWRLCRPATSSPPPAGPRRPPRPGSPCRRWTQAACGMGTWNSWTRIP